MTDLLKSVPVWFLVLTIIVLGAYFLYSIKTFFAGLQNTLTELKELIRELFDGRNDHAERMAAIETRCKERHCERSGYDRRADQN